MGDGESSGGTTENGEEDIKIPSDKIELGKDSETEIVEKEKARGIGRESCKRRDMRGDWDGKGA